MDSDSEDYGEGASPEVMLNPSLMPYRLDRLALGVAVAALWLAGVGATASEATVLGYPRITYSKVLHGSTPEYVSITVDRLGNAIYEAGNLNEPAPLRNLQLRDATTQKVFDLAGVLNNFDEVDLESYKKVANLGHKTLVYDDGSQKHQATFNYTTRQEAQELIEIFDKISAVGQHIATLEHSIQFDRLRLPEQLKQIQKDLDRRALAEPELMEPILRKIAQNPRFLHLAQSRAQNILGRLQNPK